MLQQTIHFYCDFETEVLISEQFPQENFFENVFPLLASWLSLKSTEKKSPSTVSITWVLELSLQIVK